MLIEEGKQRLESKYFLPYFAIWFYQFLKISPKKKDRDSRNPGLVIRV
jgi:hypothetical protein